MARYVRNALRDLWAEKLAGVRRAKALETVTLVPMFLHGKEGCDIEYDRFPENVVVLTGGNLNGLLEPRELKLGSQDWGRCFPQLWAPFLECFLD